MLDWLGAAIAGLDSAPGRIMLEHTGAQPDSARPASGWLKAARPRWRRSTTASSRMWSRWTTSTGRRPSTLRWWWCRPRWPLPSRSGASGKDFLTAVTLGYEVAIRVGESVGKTHYFHWHNTSTCGVFGATAAAGWLLGLDQERMTWALGNAGSQAGGLWEFIADGAMSKVLHAGRAAANGVLAAESGRSGSPERARSGGPEGFFAATAPDGNPAAVTERWLQEREALTS